MYRRPPQRRPSDPREQAVHAYLQFTGVASVAGPAAGEAQEGAAGETEGPAPMAANREEFVEMLADMRRQGSLTVADEAAILRDYDGFVVELRHEKARLEAEFRDRVVRDGEQDAGQWLEAAATSLGRKQGERMRRLMQTVPALAEGMPG